VSLGNIQTLTLVAVSSFGESLRWVPHHPSGGSHLSAYLKITLQLVIIIIHHLLGRIIVKAVPEGDDSSQILP
jgi:hypothetical protein